jgi:hypothetical protein
LDPLVPINSLSLLKEVPENREIGAVYKIIALNLEKD